MTTSRILHLTALALLLGGTTACDESSPTEPSDSFLTVEAATVTVDGQDVTNGTWHHAGGQQGRSTRFEARLSVNGRPASNESAYVDFHHPEGGSHMMASSGRFQLYDDGTHGDHVPGDGLYCLEDFEMGYGPHHSGAAHGEYRYEFYGWHHQGRESNRVHVTVHVGD